MKYCIKSPNLIKCHPFRTKHRTSTWRSSWNQSWWWNTDQWGCQGRRGCCRGHGWRGQRPSWSVRDSQALHGNNWNQWDCRHQWCSTRRFWWKYHHKLVNSSLGAVQWSRRPPTVQAGRQAAAHRPLLNWWSPTLHHHTKYKCWLWQCFL